MGTKQGESYHYPLGTVTIKADDGELIDQFEIFEAHTHREVSERVYGAVKQIFAKRLAENPPA